MSETQDLPGRPVSPDAQFRICDCGQILMLTTSRCGAYWQHMVPGPGHHRVPEGASIHPERDEQTLREHLLTWHIYDRHELEGLQLEGLTLIHRGMGGGNSHPFQRTPHPLPPPLVVKS